jgi:hypothetical protein
MPPRRTLLDHPPSVHADTCHRDHTDFSESTEEIAPLTEEEKKARLEDLRQKLKAKRENQSVADKEDAKRNEVGRATILHQHTTNSLRSKSA